MRITFDDTVTSIGRNGSIKTKGLEIMDSGKNITIFPISSKGTTANCMITIPKDHITAFISELNDLNIEPLILDTSEIRFLREVESVQGITCPKCGEKGFYQPYGLRNVFCEYCGAEWEIQKLKDGLYIGRKV